ncbi:MAG TPA: hypothetical protein PLO61_08485 [Fimbriimonadaceae bacterium]|nr:hypothetical protein [Fimbriimonadaceae bacterium]
MNHIPLAQNGVLMILFLAALVMNPLDPPAAPIVPATPPEPAALIEIKKLAGGVWKGTVGNNMPVEIRYTLFSDGTGVEARGTVGDPKKPAMNIFARMGLDPATRTVYYIDLHNNDTIYFGECKVKDRNLEINFKGLSGDLNQYRNRLTFINKDEMDSALYNVKPSGEETYVHTLNLKRTPSTETFLAGV